ncbi:MAG: Hsp20/alpha crystallin family protein [Halanaeroarchaeum sp.]
MVPAPQQTSDEVAARRYDYGDRSLLAVDLGPVAADATVEVVDDTAIVVFETPDGPRQHEIDLPADAAAPTINNGVLTLEVSPE